MTGELWDFAHTSYLANWVAGAPVVVNSMFANLVEGSLTLLKPRRSGAEGGTRSRMSRSPAHAPTKGPSPLVPSLRFGHPMKGVFPLQNPQFESRLYSFC